MANEAERQEYVLNENGIIFVGNANYIEARGWYYGQVALGGGKGQSVPIGPRDTPLTQFKAGGTCHLRGLPLSLCAVPGPRRANWSHSGCAPLGLLCLSQGESCGWPALACPPPPGIPLHGPRQGFPEGLHAAQASAWSFLSWTHTVGFQQAWHMGRCHGGHGPPSPVKASRQDLNPCGPRRGCSVGGAQRLKGKPPQSPQARPERGRAPSGAGGGMEGHPLSCQGSPGALPLVGG